MITTKELFEDNKWGGFHDVIVDTLDISPTKEQAMEIFNKLPEHVRNIAHQWGMSDTVFRDEAYEEIERAKIRI